MVGVRVLGGEDRINPRASDHSWCDEEALENKAKELGVKLLISGHSHELKTSHHNQTYFLNPGSMTGSYSPLKVNAVPSFMILEFKSSEIVVYEYSLVEGS